MHRVQRTPDGTIVVHVKERGERNIERITMALLVVWLGAMIIADEPRGMAPLGFGGILLASAVYQRFSGYHPGILTWVFGVVLVAVGIGDLGIESDVPWFGIAVVLAGLWLLYRAIRRRS